jgi:hypothetical protein
LAQTVDEQLLSAQMAYQQANNQQEQAAERLKQAQVAKQQADQRLLDAQNAVQKAQMSWLRPAVPTWLPRQQMQQQTQQLNEAWKRKEAGGQ